MKKINRDYADPRGADIRQRTAANEAATNVTK